jgi:competence protein ComFC
LRCLLCQAPLPGGVGRFCPSCDQALRADRELAACPLCGRSVAPFEVSGGQCGVCRSQTTRLSGTARVGPYEPLLGRLVKAYKYAGREELEPILGNWLTGSVRQAPWFKRIEAITCVPAHWWHRLTKPTHAAQSLASYVARQTQLPFVPLLNRVRPGRQQVGLSYIRRCENVRGLFALTQRAVLKDTHLLLIDDVRTTGATLEECAKVLRRNGAREVFAAIVVKKDWAQHARSQPIPV